MEKTSSENFNPTDKPHDTLIKAYLSNQKACNTFIHTHFADKLTQPLKKVKLTNKSYVKKEFRQLHSDLVFKLHFQNQATGYACLLCEAESGKPDPYFIFRISGYLEALIRTHMKMHPKEKNLPSSHYRACLPRHNTPLPLSRADSPIHRSTQKLSAGRLNRHD